MVSVFSSVNPYWRLINTHCWGVPCWGGYPQTSTKIHEGTPTLRWWHLWLFSSVVTLRAHCEIVLRAIHSTSSLPCGHTLFDLYSLMSRRIRMVYGLRMFVYLHSVTVSATGTTFVPCWIIWLTSKFGEQTTSHHCFRFLISVHCIISPEQPRQIAFCIALLTIRSSTRRRLTGAHSFCSSGVLIAFW